MADVFKKENASSLLRGKHVLFIGDSNIRALYKDLLWLYKMNSLIDISFLKRRVSKKLENSFLGDRILARSELTRGRDFVEHRIFEDGGTTIEFLFVTRCYCNNIIKMVNDIKDGRKHCPDVILMNSCLWDVSRWGPSGVSEYKSNMDKLMKLLSSSLPKHVLFIWATALPIAGLTSGGLIIKEIEFMQAILRIHVIEANSFTAALAASYGYDVLDFHHYMRYQIIRRSADGIHFLPAAVRFLTNLLLTHIALSWDVKLPRNLKTWTMPLASNIDIAIKASADHEMKQMFQKIEILADTLNKTDSDSPSKKKRRKKKKKNIRVTHLVEQPQPSNLQQERALMKTPPYYHKASPVFKRTICDIRNNNFVARIEGNNLPSSSNCPGPNFQVTRQSYMNNLEKEDFRLRGCGDFYRGINIQDTLTQLSYAQWSNIRYDEGSHRPRNATYNHAPHSGYAGYYPSQLQYATNFPDYYGNESINSVYNYNDRFSSYHSHPYKSSNDSMLAWGDDDFYQNRNPGPIRRREQKHYYRR